MNVHGSPAAESFIYIMQVLLIYVHEFHPNESLFLSTFLPKSFILSYLLMMSAKRLEYRSFKLDL